MSDCLVAPANRPHDQQPVAGGRLIIRRQKGLDSGPLISSRRETSLSGQFIASHPLAQEDDDDRINSIRFVMDTVMAMEYQALTERQTQTKKG